MKDRDEIKVLRDELKEIKKNNSKIKNDRLLSIILISVACILFGCIIIAHYNNSNDDWLCEDNDVLQDISYDKIGR